MHRHRKVEADGAGGDGPVVVSFRYNYATL